MGCRKSPCSHLGYRSELQDVSWSRRWWFRWWEYGRVQSESRFRGSGQRVCLTCCEVEYCVTHWAGSEMNFQIWKADASSVTPCDTRTSLGKSLLVSFPPLTTRRGSQRRAERLRVFFTPLSTRDLLFHFSRFRGPLTPGICLRIGPEIIPFALDPCLSFLSRMSENTSSIATSRPTRSTRGTTAAASTNKTTATTNTKPRGGTSTKKNGVGAGKKKAKGKGEKEQVYCICREKDYGSPMICCGACREW